MSALSKLGKSAIPLLCGTGVYRGAGGLIRQCLNLVLKTFDFINSTRRTLTLTSSTSEQTSAIKVSLPKFM